MSDVRIGLIKLGSALAASAEQPALSDDLPLTDTSVRDILSLDTAIGTLVDDALAVDSDTTLDTLADAFPDDGPLTVKEVTPPADAPADSREWTMDIALEASRPVALMYQDKRLEFGTAALGGELAATLKSKIRFRYVPGAIDLRTFAIVGSSDLTTHVWTRGEDDDSDTGQRVDIPRFKVVDGFVQLDAQGEATIDTTTVLALRDPNGRGLITTEDFEFSSATELFNTTTAPQADDVTMKIDLTSDMDDSATGTVTVGPRAEDADTTYAAVKVDRSDALDDIASLTRLQAITGFTQYTSALQAVEGSVDQQFPLLDLALTDLYSPGQQLLDLLTEQATATIVCGAADTMPPSGAPRPGQVRYCQAVTSSFEAKTDKPITWESPDEGVDIEPGSYAGTIGREPTKNVVVSGGDGFPTLRVGFTSDDNVVRHARTAVTSVQALGRAIGKLGLDGAVDYDPAKQALQIAVRQDKDDSEPVERTVSTGGNGNLAPLTGLGGLCQAAAGIEPRICQQTGDTAAGSHPDPQEGQATVTTDGRSFHADFGIGLTEPTTPTEGEPVPAEPTFYLVPGDDGLVYEVESATADLAKDAKLVARVGFLQVDVDVTDYSLDRDGTAASVSVPTTTVTLPSDEKVSDAVTVAGLLSAGSAAGVTPEVVRGLSAKATLKVEDSQQSDKDANGNLIRPIKAQGTIKADWATLRPDALPSVTTEGDYDKLRLLDLVPARRGTMGDETSGTTIHDPGADFYTQFGIDGNTPEDDRYVTQPLYDLGVAGSSSTICTKLYVVSNTKLRCDAGPLATPDTVATGHPYLIDGDPDALRNILVEDLAAVVTSFAAPDPSLGADRTFPLVDVLPTEISVARNALGKALSGVQEQIAAEVPNPALSVQSMQAFASTFDKLAGQAVTGQDRETDRKLKFTLTPGNPGKLVLETSMETKGTRQAPLRVATDKSEVRVIGSTGDGKEKVAQLPVDVASKARFVIGVNLADASSQVRADTGVTEEITKISGDADDLSALKATLSGRDTDYGSARVKTGAAADVELGIGVGAVTSPPGSDGTWIDLKQLPAQIEQTRSVVGDHQTCGNPSGDASDIAACIELPIAGDPAPDPVMAALKADETSGGAGGSVAAEPIAYRFLAEAMGGLNLTLSDALDGDQTLDDAGAPLSLPLVGTNLDAGADVPADVNTYVAAARSALTDVEEIEETATVTDLQTDLQTALDAAKDQVAGKNITATTGAIDLACTTTCTDKTVADVQQIMLPITLSGELPTPQQVPFRVGPAGSTIVSDLTVPTKTTWTLDVTVGIARGTGPFVQLGDATADKPLLKVEIDSQLPKYDTSANKCHSWARQSIWHGKVVQKTDREIRNIDVPANASADAECLDAFVGKFPSVMVDRQKDGGRGTFLDATIKVDVPAPGGGGAELVYLPALFDKKVDFVTKASGTGSISTYFESFASQAGFFDIVGTIDLSWSKDGYSSDGLRFGLLQLDVTTVNNAVLPGFDKAKKWLAPLNPVVDQLTRPIPVVTNLSELVGSGPVTLMTLLQKKNTPLNLIVNLLQLQNLIAGGPTTGADLREIGTGTLAGFKVDPAKVGVGGKCTETGTADGKPHTRTNDGKGASGRCRLGNFTKMKQYVTGEKPPKDPKGLKVDKTVTRSPYISLPSVSVPVLQDTSQIFNLIEDSGDATMLYVDLGHAGVSGQIIRKFGPFAVGPIPVTASIGGTVGLDGRFAFGFDTRGLSRKLEALDTGDISGFDDLTIGKPNEAAPAKISVFSDGFYIDDLEKGVDVPEISLTFTVQAGAAISLGIFEAGITGGVTLDLSLDAFDPNGDGKIYTDEFAGTSSGPDCAFNVSSGISFFLQFYFSIELIFYTIHKAFDIVRSPRYTLFEFNCRKEDPKLAILDGDGTANPELVLTMGPERARRKGYDAPGEHLAEKYTVRQLGPPTTIDGKDVVDLQVSAFSLTENHRVPANTVIKADGADGSDTIRLYPIPTITTDDKNRPEMAGPGDPGYVAPKFTQAAVIKGGNGADTIETGDADDDVQGEAGSDSIRTGAGNDTIRGGDDSDQLDAGEGQDTIEGGGGDDRIQGGPGADEVRGDAGDDMLDGGVGSSPDMLFPTTSAARIRPLLDAGDLVVGGDGADTVDGGNGSDVVVGGSYAARADYVTTQSNTVYGVDEANRIQRVDVNGVQTLKLPSEEAVRQECASSGASGELGPDVVTGGGERDLVIGGAGSDTLSGGGGDDVVCGRAGDDLLDGDGQDVDENLQGDDVVRGGPGKDRMYGSAGQDDMYGDLGDDLVRGGQDDDTLSGGAGSDLLLGEGGIDQVEGDAPAGDSQVTTDPADDDRSGRAITCSTSTSVVGGGIDLDGDLAGNDDGRLEGMTVDGGRVKDAADNNYNGIVSGVVFVDGQADLDGNGVIEARTRDALGDTGSIPLGGITGAAGNGDCILGGDEVDDRLDGGVGADYVDAGAGDDTDVRGGPGNDLVRGGDGRDLVHGDSGDDLVAGDAGGDILFGNAGDDVVRGGSGDDLVAGGSSNAGADDGADEVLGDGGDDAVLGGNGRLSRTALADTAIAGVSVTLLDTEAGDDVDDLVYGGTGNDWVFAQSGDDEAYGGPGQDVVEGGPGKDRVQGDDGEDLVVGGSSTTGAVTKDRSAAGTADGDDVVLGDGGVDGDDRSDVLVGDNARLQIDDANDRPSWARVRDNVSITLFDVPTDAGPAATPDPDASGNDTLRGGGFDDLIFGQSGDDTIEGGTGADGIEGGAGQDTVRGDDGDDEILGGSWTASTHDDDDELHGDDGMDVLIGDNGNPANGFSPYVKLHDVPAPGAITPAAWFGGDELSGGDGDDQLFGQSGEDTIAGSAGVDLLEGGADHDTMSGGSDDDTLTGGSSSGDGVISPERDGAGQLDADDEISGGPGDDVLAGDNARLIRTDRQRTDGTRLRSVQLFDLSTATVSAPIGTGGGDTLDGDEGRDLVFGQAGADTLGGGTGADYLEGNDGADTLVGGAGEDDLVGGGSTRNGAVITISGASVVDRLLTAPGKTVDDSAAGLVDGNDVLDGGDSRDVLLGDNGRVTRGGPNKTLAGGASGTHVVRQVAMADKVPGVWSGSDQLTGGAGDDDLYGQFDNSRTKRPQLKHLNAPVPGDILAGGTGDDALVGDQGVVVPTPAAALGAVNRVVKDKSSFIREVVRPRGTLVKVVTLTHSTIGGDDLVLGNDGADSIHAGAGTDVVNAGAQDDVVFGGDGNDALWGGANHDLVFGGAGNDLLDIKRRTKDAKLWQVSAPVEDTDRRRRTVNGRDVLYGGSGRDAMQADQGDEGSGSRVQGDRLIDWRSTTNFFKTCQSGYGAGKVSNVASTSMTSALRLIAAANGAVGSAELAIASSKERVTKYPDTRTFICESS